MYIFLPLVTMLPIALFTLYIYNSQQGRSPWRGVLGIMIGFLLILAAFYGILYDSSDINPNPAVSSLTIIMEYGYIAITAFLPALAYMIYIIAMDDKKPEPLQVLLLTDLLGCVAAFASIAVGSPLFHGGFYTELSHNLIDSIHIGFLKIAIPSELIKWLFLILFLSLNKYYDEDVDGIVYSVSLAMGFACVVCIWYLYDNVGMPSFILKGLVTALILIPIHWMAGAVMGYFVALARKGKKLLNYLLALVAAVFVDGVICSMLAMMGYHWGYYFITGIVLFVLSLIVYRQIRHLMVLDDLRVE